MKKRRFPFLLFLLMFGGLLCGISLMNSAEPLETNIIEALSEVEPEVGTCCPKKKETCTIGTHTFTDYEYRKEGPCNPDN